MKYILSLFLISSVLIFKSQNPTWVKGGNAINQAGIYGTLGTAAAANTPGSREGGATWKDSTGCFWVFGGNGQDFLNNNGLLNDLWKYNPATNQWTWIKGDQIINQLGTYGSLAAPNATNKPGARQTPCTWTDANGNFWMFGGWGYSANASLGYLNDLWKFNPGTGLWTWMGGSTIPYQGATYGTQGVPSALNIPGARTGHSAFSDAQGMLWLFGGLGNTTNSMTVGYLNDLWKYNPTTGEWTWVSGNNSINQNGIYGSIGISNSNNKPGSRLNCTSWKDNSGNFWVFGGMGYDASNTLTQPLNDLWKYNPSTNQWTWMKGSTNCCQAGQYGTMGIASPLGTPGARTRGISWVDPADNLWIMGGEGFAAGTFTTGALNDWWRYNITTNDWLWIRGGNFIGAAGFYGTQGLSAPGNVIGARRMGHGWIDQSNNLWLLGGNGKGNSSATGYLNDLWKYPDCLVNPITLTITSLDSVVCAGETTTLVVNGASSYSWSNGSTSYYNIIIPTVTTQYTASTTTSIGCVFSSVFTQSTLPCTGIENLNDSHMLSVYPQPSSGTIQFSKPVSGIFQLMDINGNCIKEIKQIENKIKLELNDVTPGLYLYRIYSETRKPITGKLILCP